MSDYSGPYSGGSAGSLPPPPPPAPPPGSGRRSVWPALAIGCGVIAVILILGSFALLFSLPFLIPFSAMYRTSQFEVGANIGVVDIRGVIHSGSGGMFSAQAGAEPIMRALRRAGDDSSLKAVVLNINSGGGSPAASQAIALEVKRLAEKKPVVAAMGDAAASGAYYVASQATQIVANGSTITGSIGVRVELLRFYRFMERYGFEGEQITSGDFKDIGSPFRPMRPEEREILQSVIEDTYDQFVRTVAEGREMPEAEVRELADGRIFTGAQAQEKGLVDELGNFWDAVDLAARLGGVRKPTLRNLTTLFGWEALFSTQSALPWFLRMPWGAGMTEMQNPFMPAPLSGLPGEAMGAGER